MQQALPNGLYPHPFSRAYWRDAARELKSIRTLVLASLIVALRVLSKFLIIRFGTIEWPIVGIVVNAFGSMCYGPVVAALVGFLSDALGFLTSTSPGDFYFPPAAIPEILSAVVFALFLYRARVNVWRLLLSRFVICFFINVLISTPITMWYYAIRGTPYAWLNIPRFIKNIITFPIDAVILAFFFRYLIPPVRQLGFVRSDVTGLHFTRKNVVVTAILTVVGMGITLGYYVYDYNSTSLSKNYTPWQRTANNLLMREIAVERDEALDPEQTVAVIESAMPRFGSPDITYTVAVYQLDRQALAARTYASGEHQGEPTNETPLDVFGYSLTPAKNAAREGVLTFLYRLEVVTGDGKNLISVSRVEENQ